MSTFGEYAQYYDLLYAEKDYARECAFVSERLAAHTNRPQCILDIGCGTGRHAVEFAQRGARVVGLDASPTMIAQATDRQARLPGEVAERLVFLTGDARTTPLNNYRFDAAVLLFHVACYHLTDDDLIRALVNLRPSLEPGGLLLFDYWNGAAVDRHGFETRIKRCEDGEVKLTRISETRPGPAIDTVAVDFDLFVESRRDGRIVEIRERHDVRYLYEDGLREVLDAAGFEPLEFRAWLADAPPTDDTWNAYCVAVRKD